MTTDSGQQIEIRGLKAGYGKKMVISDISFDSVGGEILGIVGHNGAGKSTLLKAIWGTIPLMGGAISVGGTRVRHPSPRWWLARRGAYLPQDRAVFGGLTVRENLELAPGTDDSLGRKAQLDAALDMFPQLTGRLSQRASTLSGGEKQMLALAMRLVSRPQIMFLDEPTVGLAPKLVSRVFEFLDGLSRERRTKVIIVEQRVRELLMFAHKACVLRNGCPSYLGDAATLRDETKLRHVYF